VGEDKGEEGGDEEERRGEKREEGDVRSRSLPSPKVYAPYSH
jgi:hypothetical protein